MHIDPAAILAAISGYVARISQLEAENTALRTALSEAQGSAPEKEI